MSWAVHHEDVIRDRNCRLCPNAANAGSTAFDIPNYAVHIKEAVRVKLSHGVQPLHSSLGTVIQKVHGSKLNLELGEEVFKLGLLLVAETMPDVRWPGLCHRTHVFCRHNQPWATPKLITEVLFPTNEDSTSSPVDLQVVDVSERVDFKTQKGFQGTKVKGRMQVVPLQVVGLQSVDDDILHVAFRDVAFAHERRSHP